MTYTEVDFPFDLATPTDGYVRTPGVHMSDLYNSYYAVKEPGRYGETGDGPPKAKMEVGTAFEEVLERAIAARIFAAERPPEFVCDHDVDCPHPEQPIVPGVPCWCGAGVLYSPDQLFYDADRTRLGEFKATWMSMRDAPASDKFAKWITQIQCYLYHLQMTECLLVGMFLNGDYKPPAPAPRAWRLQFSSTEIQQEWRLIRKHAQRVGLLPTV